MKKLFQFIAVLTVVLFGRPLAAQPADLFISEYVEGSSNNKALELYNGTASPIDLGAGQYLVELYFNGSSSPASSLPLTGTIVPGGTFIMAHSSAVLGITSNLSSANVNFNGDDAVVLKKGGAAGTVLDVIGQVGFDPGTQWGANDTATADRSIRRKPSICQGEITTANIFYISQEWEGYPVNTFGGLGSHSVTCGTPPQPVNGLALSTASLSFTAPVNVPSLPQAYTITGNTLTAPVTVTAPAFFELSLSAGGPFSSSLSIPQASFGTGAVTVHVRYLPTAAGTNTGVAAHSSGAYTASLGLTGTAISIMPVSQIQGTAAASAYTNQVILTEGIVTADYQGVNELGGFYIQDAVSDGNPATSDGIFVLNTSYSVNPGDLVRIVGTVEEYFDRTQIKSLTSLSIQSTGNTVTPVNCSLPVSAANDFEKLEGMRVKFTQALTVSEVYTLARFGEILLSGNGRLMQPTNFVDPNDAVASGTNSSGTSNLGAVTAQQNLNSLNQITLDDKSNVQNPPIVPYVDPVNNTLRCGSTIADLDGVMDYAFSLYRIQPVAAPAFTYAPRPAVPSVGGANVKVASFNVLNYFNGNGTGGGFPTSRGANTAVEFTRQRAKIIEAIKQINADVVGLMEMENDGNGAQSAIADLVSGLNTSMGAGTYTFVADPTAGNGGTGTDEIKVALIYKPSVVTCTGSSKADNNPVHNRPPLSQTFLLNSSQEKFSVIVNHFKSKSCSGATGANTDQSDGQSCFNDSRKQQAAALLSYISTVKTQAADNDVIAIGDFNAYEQEDPIDMLIGGGLTHLLNNTYSYVFTGQSGSLDHAFVSSSLAGQVSGADKWHINSDEPVAKDYNQEFNPAYMYSADPFRSSDHDPLLIGLNLQPLVTISVTATSGVQCFGLSTGAATISATGSGPLSYTWLPTGGNTTTATGLSAGVYTVAVSDGTNTAATTVTITQPSAALTSSVASQTSVTCNGGGNGSATIAASGGTGSFTYSWMPAGGSGSTALSLTAGMYTVSIKDANLCGITQTVNIAQPPAITVSVVGSSSVTCNGLSNGSATVAASGGTGSFTYSWSPTGGTNASAASLATGIYTVIVKDANLCSAAQTVNIVQPQAIAVSVVGSSSVTCNGLSNGSATVSASGGTGSFTYSWSPTGGTNASAASLATGVYTIMVKDANLCSATQTINIVQPQAITVSLIGSSSVTCNSLSNGSATVAASGGTGSFTYSWSPTGGTNASAASLATGIYTVIVKDANLCSAIQTVNIMQPQAITVSVTGSSSVTCNGLSNGSATVSASGGTGSFTYSWSPTGGTNASAALLAAGVYTVAVKDANLCSATQTISIMQPAPIDVSTTVNGLVITANAGSASYQWINCGNGNSPVAGATSQSFSPTADGSYAVMITKSACSATSTCVSMVLTGINSLPVDNDYLIYPNPASNSITITASGSMPDLITVYNNLGQVVYSSANNNNDKTIIDLANQPNGLYFVKLQSGNSSIIKKVIKVN